MSQTVATHIELRPNRSGQLRAYIEGTQIRVQDIYGYGVAQGYSPEWIVENLPQLTLGQVHSALSYFYDHREEILDELRQDEEFVQEMRQRTGPGPMEQRLKERNAASDNGA
jgi:uncharacterized protein (DUF433 family)